MKKSNATIKVDTEENWNKAVNYIPDIFTIIVYESMGAPKIKIGDGKTRVKDLPFLSDNKVENDVLVL